MKKSKKLPAVLLTARLLTGCSSPEKPPVPNATLVDAAHTLSLPKLATQKVVLKADYSVDQTTNALVDLSDRFTKDDQARFKNVQAFVLQLLMTPIQDTTDVTTPTGNHETVIVQRTKRDSVESDYIFYTPQQAKTVEAATSSFTFFDNANKRTFSLILMDGSPNPIEPRISKQSVDVAIEVCQSETQISIYTNKPVVTGIAAIEQESFCNGLGRAIAAKETRLTYPEYLKAFGGTLIERDHYKMAQYTVSAAVYNAMPN